MAIEYNVFLFGDADRNIDKRHVKLVADSGEEIAALWAQFTAAMEPSATEEQPDTTNTATPPARVECPVHRRVRQGKFGLHCPTKMGDGWCDWRAPDQPEGLPTDGPGDDFE